MQHICYNIARGSEISDAKQREKGSFNERSNPTRISLQSWCDKTDN